MKNIIKTFDTKTWISVISLLVSVLSAYIALQASAYAKRANELATEANEIARESNKIALLDISSDVNPVRGTGVPPISVYGCKYQPDDWNIYSLVDISLLMTNSGGRAVSLIEAKVTGDHRNWNVNVYDQENLELGLPVDFEANVSRRWQFIARAIEFGKSEEDAAKLYETSRGAHPVLTWELHFGNGKIFTWETQTYGSSPGLDFVRECPK